MALFFVLGSLPAFFLFGDIRRTAVNVPFMDDWQFISLLEKAKYGTLTFQELWAPHDEHRLLLPRIIIIAAMFASKGDYRVQCCVSFLAVEIISLCFLWLLIRLNGERFGVSGDVVLGEHCSVLADPISKLALADAVCVFPPVHVLGLMSLCIVSSDRSGKEVRLAAACALGWKL